jgi:hypothetical protein
VILIPIRSAVNLTRSRPLFWTRELNRIQTRAWGRPVNLQSLSSGTGQSPAAAASKSTTTGSSAANPSTARKLLLGTVSAALGQQGQTGGLSGIVATVRAALVAGLAAGKNVEPALADKINAALQQAAQELEAKGVDPAHTQKLVARFSDDLSQALGEAARAASTQSTPATSANTASWSSGNNAASAISSINSSSIGPGTGAAVGSSGSGGSSFSAYFVARESATLKIQTVEGDQVTIRLKEMTSASLQASQTQATGATSSGAAVTVVSRGRLQVEVSGNLNPDELKAIGDVLSQVDALATQFFSGDVQGAFHAAANMGVDPTEIASFGLKLSYSAALFQSSASPATQPTQSVQPLTATSPPGSLPALSDSSTTAGATSPAGAQATPASADSPSLSPAAPAASARQTIANFVQDVLAKLGANSGTARVGISMRWKLEVLAQSLPAYAPSQTAAATQATNLAANTLTRLAA